MRSRILLVDVAGVNLRHVVALRPDHGKVLLVNICEIIELGFIGELGHQGTVLYGCFLRHLGEEFGVYLGDVIGFGDAWYEGWWDLLHIQFLPVDVCEPGVVLDLSDASSSAADSLTWDLDEELGAEVCGLFAEVCRHFYLFLKYLVHLVDK